MEDMKLQHMLRSKWFIRSVMACWIVCAVSIFIVFKNMELIVHGQLYSYGLIFSSDWADPYRLFTWLIFIFLGLPSALSCLALAGTFLKVKKIPEKKIMVPQKLKQVPAAAKVESQPVVRGAPKQVENDSDGAISCPYCNKLFGRALVMLDFHDGKNQLVSVCPYCNHVLGNTNEEKSRTADFHVAISK